MSLTVFQGSWGVLIFVSGVIKRMIILPITYALTCVERVEVLGAFGKTTVLCAGNANGCLKVRAATIDIKRNRSMVAAEPCVK